MRRTARGVVAVALVVLTAVILARRLPAPVANGRARQCEIPGEPPRPLRLDRLVDRAHLRADAATAESWAIAYADVSPHRREGAGPYAKVLEQCMATLFGRVSQRHGVDVAAVRAYAEQRDIMFDVAVLLGFALAYALVAYQLVGIVMRRFSIDERFALATALAVVSLMSMVIALLVGDTWSIAAEIVRVGNGHLSYRTERLPWRQYRPAIAATLLGMFWLVAAFRTTRVLSTSAGISPCHGE
jgi:hypothetical protein